MYQKSHFDLAGFVVGIVDQTKALGKHRVNSGSELVALASSGFHSNGYSLIRKWLGRNANTDGDKHLIEQLLVPTKIYHEIPKILRSLPEVAIEAIAHITGGGLVHNISRVIPEQLRVEIDWESIVIPGWMDSFIRSHGYDPYELSHIFNLGVGMVLVVHKDYKEEVDHICRLHQLDPFKIGTVETNTKRNKQTNLDRT